MGFKLRNKDILSRINSNPHVKPSGFKFSDPGAETTYEYRTNTTSSPRGQVVNVGGGSRKAADRKQYEKWGSQYLWGLKNIGLLDDYKETRGDAAYKNMQERYETAREYYDNLTPEQQWQVQNYRYKTYYPNKYEEWQELNPQVTTTVKERRGTTTTPGTSQASGGGFEDVWASMSDEQKAQYDNNFDAWKTAAEEWNANPENQGTPGSVEQGDWEVVSRNTRRH